jgi:hypothetical protein
MHVGRVADAATFVSDEQIDQFISGCHAAHFWHSRSYLHLLSATLGAADQSLLAVDDHQQIVGYLPVLEMDGPLGPVWNSLPFFGSHGDLLVRSDDARRRLSNELSASCEERDVFSCTVVSSPDSNLTVDLGFDYTESRLLQATSLAAGSSQLIARLHPKQRNAVKKGLAGPWSYDQGSNFLEFISTCHEENMTHLGGRPKPRHFFQNIPNFFPAATFEVRVAKDQGRPVAGLLLFLWEKTVEYFTPVLRAQYRESQVLSALIYSSMLELEARGYETWNWGGTWRTQTGVYRFKSRWDAEDHHYELGTAIRRKEVLSGWRSHELMRHYGYFYVWPHEGLEPK